MPQIRDAAMARDLQSTPDVTEIHSFPLGDGTWNSSHNGSEKQYHLGELLLLGHDQALQGTRVSLLEWVGFHCQSSDGAARPSELGRHHFDVIILCHTLTIAEAYEALEQVKLGSPSTAVLRLAKHGQPEEAGFQHVLVAPSPARLLATVQRLSA